MRSRAAPIKFKDKALRDRTPARGRDVLVVSA